MSATGAAFQTAVSQLGVAPKGEVNHVNQTGRSRAFLCSGRSRCRGSNGFTAVRNAWSLDLAERVRCNALQGCQRESATEDRDVGFSGHDGIRRGIEFEHLAIEQPGHQLQHQFSGWYAGLNPGRSQPAALLVFHRHWPKAEPRRPFGAALSSPAGYAMPRADRMMTAIRIPVCPPPSSRRCGVIECRAR